MALTYSLTRRRFMQCAAGTVAASALPWPARSAADEFAALDATAQAALVRSGQVAPIELVDAAIARIEHLNPILNAIVTPFFDRARDQARGDLPSGPFSGVPYAIKDLSDYEGARTTFGSRLFAENVADESNGIVQSALAAGLVILGKTNTPEFGLISTTESVLLGPARNPWSLDHHTGGSSDGAAAAVASGMLPFAQASDGGGSIRIPASVCGVFGLKPSRGRIFRTDEGLPHRAEAIFITLCYELRMFPTLNLIRNRGHPSICVVALTPGVYHLFAPRASWRAAPLGSRSPGGGFLIICSPQSRLSFTILPRRSLSRRSRSFRTSASNSHMLSSQIGHLSY